MPLALKLKMQEGEAPDAIPHTWIIQTKCARWMFANRWQAQLIQQLEDAVDGASTDVLENTKFFFSKGRGIHNKYNGFFNAGKRRVKGQEVNLEQIMMYDDNWVKGGLAIPRSVVWRMCEPVRLPLHGGAESGKRLEGVFTAMPTRMELVHQWKIRQDEKKNRANRRRGFGDEAGAGLLSDFSHAHFDAVISNDEGPAEVLAYSSDRVTGGFWFLQSAAENRWLLAYAWQTSIIKSYIQRHEQQQQQQAKEEEGGGGNAGSNDGGNEGAMEQWSARVGPRNMLMHGLIGRVEGKIYWFDIDIASLVHNSSEVYTVRQVALIKTPYIRSARIIRGAKIGQNGVENIYKPPPPPHMYDPNPGVFVPPPPPPAHQRADHAQPEKPEHTPPPDDGDTYHSDQDTEEHGGVASEGTTGMVTFM